MSADAYSIYVIPSDKRDSAEAARLLAPYLTLSEEEIKNRFENSSGNFYLALEN